MSEPRRLRFMRIAPEWFVDMCKGVETRRCRPSAHVLPSDAKFLDVKVSDRGHAFVVIESASFAVVEPDALIPEHPPVEFQIVRYAHDLRESMASPAPINRDALNAITTEMTTSIDAWAANDDVPSDVTRQVRRYLERLQAVRDEAVN